MLSYNVRADNSSGALHFFGSLYMSHESAASKPWFYVATLIFVVSYEYDATKELNSFLKIFLWQLGWTEQQENNYSFA